MSSSASLPSQPARFLGVGVHVRGGARERRRGNDHSEKIGNATPPPCVENEKPAAFTVRIELARQHDSLSQKNFADYAAATTPSWPPI
jgi:hypothetical protein